MTATVTESQILDLFLARAALMATQGPALPIAFPEIAFTPPTSGKSLEVWALPNKPFWEGLSGSSVDQGIYQVTVHWPRGQGQIAPLKVAGQVRQFFPRGTELFAAGLRVEIYAKPWYSQPIPGDVDLIVPVSIPYRAFEA